MIARLIQRDRALRLLPPWLLLGVLMGLMLSANQQAAVRHGLTVGVHGFQGFRYSAHLPWGLITVYLLYAGVTNRCSCLDMTLPLPHRVLWLSRVLALSLGALVLVATAAITLLLRNWVEGFQVVGRTHVESLLAQLAAVSILAVILVSMRQPSLHKLPLKAANTLYLSLVWIGGWGILYALAGQPPGYALLPLGTALILGLWSYRSLPGPFVLVSRDAEKAPETGKVTATDPKGAFLVERAGALQLHLAIGQTLYRHWLPWLLVAVLLALGPAGARPEPNGGLHALWLFMLYWLLLSALFGFAVARLPRLDSLPISRKLVFAYLVLPGLLVASLGYAGAEMIQMGRTGRSPLVDYRQHPVIGDWDVQVPLALWEIGWDGKPPPVEEPYVPPWEEPHYPWSVSLFEGMPVILYSPYHAPEGSPPEVIATQLSRAVEAVYGAQIPPEELQRRYLGTEASGGGGVRSGGITLTRDYPDLKPATPPTPVLLIGLPWLLYLALTVRGGYVHPDAGRWPWGPFLLAGFGLLWILGSVWSYNAGLTAEWKLMAFAAILVRKLAALMPSSTLVQWVIVLAVLAGAYLLAQARFQRVETPATVPGGAQWTL
jgi:hypothetical protein